MLLLIVGSNFFSFSFYCVHQFYPHLFMTTIPVCDRTNDDVQEAIAEVRQNRTDRNVIATTIGKSFHSIHEAYQWQQWPGVGIIE